nr:hypothetical protein [Legionella tunisiensis]
MLIIPEFHLPSLTKASKERYLRYAMQVLEAQQQMITKKGKNILHYTLEKKRRHVRMNHYPKGDRIDHNTGAQYFYHCHREDLASNEHGHFHCFLRYKHIPKQVKPTALPDWDKNIDNPMTHLVAISMNRYGQPIRLFTVNRWISYEIWYDAKHISRFIKQYKMTLNDNPYWQVLDRWVEGMLHLFAPQIDWLYQARDAAVAHHKTIFPDNNAYEDKQIEEWSEISIDLNQQVQWLLNTEPETTKGEMVV